MKNTIIFLYKNNKKPSEIAQQLNISVGLVYKFLRQEKLVSYKTSSSNLLYNNPKYIEWRTKVLTRDNYACISCGHTGSKTNPLQVDHIKPKALYPELMFNTSNGRTLCLKCHKKTDTYGKNNIKKYSKKL